jgi:pre-rRNA-processing protein TSR1
MIDNSVHDGGSAATVATGMVSLPGTNGDYLATGHYVTLEITNLPITELHQKLEEVQTSGYLCLFSLLQHEYKLSLLHFTLQRSGDTERVIKSKDQLIFEVCYCCSSSTTCSRHHFPQTPFRQFEGKTIFSESNLNCDKHKMERFFKVSFLLISPPPLSLIVLSVA